MTGTDRFETTAVRTDAPAPARVYGWMLGSKDNFAVDRHFLLGLLPTFPECVDVARQNRQFLYRAVRHLAGEAGIRQFIDMGCGLPTENNVHQIAQRLAPNTRVVYVDIDPIVLAHGRALLTDSPVTAVINADIRDQQAILEHPDVVRLIDFSKPVAVLFLSVGHHLTDADNPRSVLRTIVDQSVRGSYLALSQVVSDDRATAREMTTQMSKAGIPWQTRSPRELDAFVAGLDPVEPGLVSLEQWRPDPTQPLLADVDPALARYLGTTNRRQGVYGYGGVLRKH